ncbi:hypothetical protein JOF29_000030 [Kribbella aluminosa]|uniref:Uncharacterized protein n=1 Tax=Kribbella aluminosa TaxID=416017 RepID=A0ABS4UBC5_9ACTN|nr:hypothetical protein [Kribbella aluminosa]
MPNWPGTPASTGTTTAAKRLIKAAAHKLIGALVAS